MTLFEPSLIETRIAPVALASFFAAKQSVYGRSGSIVPSVPSGDESFCRMRKVFPVTAIFRLDAPRQKVVVS